MLDIGFGFEPDATGYENIILSNITRGLRKDTIDKLVADDKLLVDDKLSFRKNIYSIE